MTTPKAGKAKQKWEPGSTVNVGGRPYVVKYQEETAPKGESKAWVIATADGSRVYRWRAFRGLELISGQELVRRRERRKPGTAAPAVPSTVSRGKPAGGDGAPSGLLEFLVSDLVEHPRPDAKDFLGKVLEYFGLKKT